MRAARTRLILATCLGLQSCAHDKRLYTPDEARAAAAVLVGHEVVVPYEANAESQALAREITSGALRSEDKLDRLLAYLRTSPIHYDAHATATASEVLSEGRGNCLALSNLLVAMGRSVGVPLVYVDGSRHVHDHEVRDDVVIDYGHVAVALPAEVAPTDRRISPDGRRLTHLGLRVIDFDGRLGPDDSFRVMSDLEAIAEAGRHQEAAELFEEAAQLSPENEVYRAAARRAKERQSLR